MVTVDSKFALPLFELKLSLKPLRPKKFLGRRARESASWLHKFRRGLIWLIDAFGLHTSFISHLFIYFCWIRRFNFAEGTVEIFAERVAARGLCAQTQAESLKYKLLGGLAVRRACYGVLRFVMESGAKGAEVSVSGKVRGQRAKSQKFSDGYMIKTGHAYE